VRARGEVTEHFLLPDEELRRKTIESYFPDPEKYVKLLLLIQRWSVLDHDYRTLNGLHQSKEWGGVGQYPTLQKMSEYARAREALRLRVTPAGDLLLPGPRLVDEIKKWQFILDVRKPIRQS
jgi:hypothetical protein